MTDGRRANGLRWAAQQRAHWAEVLREQDEEIIAMRDVERLTLDQIGIRLGISRQGAYRRLRKARGRAVLRAA